MEVHSHSHTPRKKWTHYLWEFLMLFLAVFCGFLAENLREHYVEHKRGEDYIKSFVEDIETDTTTFSFLIEVYQEKRTALDHLFECYDTLTGTVHSNSCLFLLEKYSANFPDLVYTDRTLQQLKNAGGLRLLNRGDADSITAYDNSLRIFEKNEVTTVQETQTLIRNISYELFNFKYSRRLWDDSLIENEVGRSSLIYPGNEALLNKYFNILSRYNVLVRYQAEDLQTLRGKAITLLTYLKKEHHL